MSVHQNTSANLTAPLSGKVALYIPHHCQQILILDPHVIALSEASKDVVVQRSFSNKRVVNGQKIGYTDFFEKIENYVALVAGPAMNKYGANPLTFKLVEEV